MLRAVSIVASLEEPLYLCGWDMSCPPLTMLTAVSSGGESACLLESLREVALVVEADGCRDVGDELVCFL